MLTIEHFRDFYREIHGDEPFPWQTRLARQVHSEGWPKLVDLPTGFGKTSTLEIAVFLQAVASPAARRRIFFVVDRRVVVDAASGLAENLALKLQEAQGGLLKDVADLLRHSAQEPEGVPLRVFSLRGGVFRDSAWTANPLQPLICCSTVDQVGSALLFRGYSATSPSFWPIQAAMAAYDSLFLLDEAHLSQPFEQTAEIIHQHYLRNVHLAVCRPLRLVSLSATAARHLGEGETFHPNSDDLAHPVLKQRYSAAKSVFLETARTDFERAVTQKALEFARLGRRRIGVIVNRVDSARAIFEMLASDALEPDVVLFTGRSRPYDRDQLSRRYLPVLQSNSEITPENPLIVAATQSLEAGADFDFDAMVTEAASWDALRQRWGRLNRMGRLNNAECWVISRGEKVDPIYGESLKTTFDWLTSQLPTGDKKKRELSSLSVSLKDLATYSLSAEQQQSMLQPRKEAPVLLPAYLDHLVHTSPAPEVELDVSLFLHGPGSGPADVQVVWRGDLRQEDSSEDWLDVVSINPPCSSEALSLPIWRLRRWLEKSSQATSPLTDLEGMPQPERAGEGPAEGRRFVIWRSEDSEVSSTMENVRPGATLILPSDYGGCDSYGWNPEFSERVTDIGDEAAYPLRRRAVLRLFDRPVLESLGGLRELLNGREETTEGRRAVLDGVRQSSRPRAITRDDEKGQLRLIAVVAPRPPRGTLPSSPVEMSSPQNSDQFSFTSDSSVFLENHLADVATRVQLYCRTIGLPQPLALAIETAARYHDLGKADPRFQALLRQQPRWAVQDSAILAKSGAEFSSARAFQRARQQAGYPKGSRHELLSVAMLVAAVEAGTWVPPADADLIAHLIASHHGRCRPFAPDAEDPEPDIAEVSVEGFRFRHATNHRLADWGSGVADRFWSLQQQFGWYGVALLESLLRLADQRVSEEGR